MCHRLEALPAIAPIAGAAVDVQDLTLTASDGTEIAVFHASAESATGPGAVILPDVRGLFRLHEELAICIAEIGVAAVAIDYCGRTAGISWGDAEFDSGTRVQATSPATTAGCMLSPDTDPPSRSASTAIQRPMVWTALHS